VFGLEEGGKGEPTKGTSAETWFEGLGRTLKYLKLRCIFKKSRQLTGLTKKKSGLGGFSSDRRNPEGGKSSEEILKGL